MASRTGFGRSLLVFTVADVLRSGSTGSLLTTDGVLTEHSNYVDLTITLSSTAWQAW